MRELREEIGLRVGAPLARLFKVEASAETDQEFVWVYRHHSEGPFTLHPDEIERGEWFTPEHVTRWVAERPEDFVRAFRLIWCRLLALH